MTLGRDNEWGLEQQRARVEAAFREGWVPVGAGEPRVLMEGAYAEARNVIGHGGWTGLDREIIEAVREGARPGDSLSPLRPRPYIDHVTEAEVMNRVSDGDCSWIAGPSGRGTEAAGTGLRGRLERGRDG